MEVATVLALSTKIYLAEEVHNKKAPSIKIETLNITGFQNV